MNAPDTLAPALKNGLNPFLQADFYKTGHPFQYPKGTNKILANFTPRSARLAPVLPELFDEKIVWFGLQGFIKEILIGLFNREFFAKPATTAVRQYQRRVDNALGKGAVTVDHLQALHDLGYLPLEIRSVPEGARVDIRVPPVTFINTRPEFAWLVTYIETLFSCESWKPSTVATIAFEYRKLLTYFAQLTGSPMAFVDWQGHDFSMRGMAGLYDARKCGAGHLLSFTGTDTIPAIDYLEDIYNADSDRELIGGSVPATEHSVMCLGSKEGEIETIRRLVKQVYPAGIVSVVSDTWDFWQVVTDFAAALKSEIMSRQPDALGNAKVVFRPDSGDPVKILTGYFCTDVPGVQDRAALQAAQAAGFEAVRDAATGTYWLLGEDASAQQTLRAPEVKGAVQCLWDTFGGVETDRGYKLLDPHVGLIYGDSITLTRARDILVRLERKGFASGNVVLGIGSYTYQYLTRDTFGWALKATYAEVNGEPQELVKDPVTDSGVKKSAKGLLRVDETPDGFVLHDQQTPEQAAGGALAPVFRDGELLVEQSLAEIRARLQGSWVCPEPGSIRWPAC
ncbi:nicotinate phosphoribosyltransferase [Achromobacter sp. Root565]|uniref:nicotinate phosphoribosyltransferase n=1 Tax=Achromobacter sp. Root565 TaxID=1736564 RepID=UPI0006FD7994|nr:nicotinate phosphoribosyltransferase [Achromobacter sp. Root565]KRA00631.1 nicotinate phosphoribosyltransferase [Achromobacter sp. Root565]